MAARDRKSKKRSGASLKSPPDPLVFFLDRSLGKHIVADSLRAAGLQVIVHDDRFPPDARDEQWLSMAGENGWVVLTKDSQIRYRTTEREAILESNARVFILVGGDLNAAQMAGILVRAIPSMTNFVARHEPPFIAKIHRSGAIAPWIRR